MEEGMLFQGSYDRIASQYAETLNGALIYKAPVLDMTTISLAWPQSTMHAWSKQPVPTHTSFRQNVHVRCSPGL
jgi:hypothetical protein